MNTKSTPSLASSAPDPKLSSGEIVSIFEDPLTETKLEGKAVCGIFLGFRDGLERWKVRFITNEHTFETEDEFHERLIKVVPAPAEDVACVTMSRECPVCKVAANHDSTWCRMCGASLAPSPAEPVKLPPLPLKLSAGLIITDARGVDIASSMSPTDTLHGEKRFDLRKQYMAALVEAANVHAAHLAKIQALTEAAKELLDASYGQFESQEAMQRLYDARAQVLALTSSLPSA